MKEVRYTDNRGMVHVTLLPDNAPESDAPRGLFVGPPDLRPLGLPPATEKRLNRQLVDRGLLSAADVASRSHELAAAVMAAYRADAQALMALYFPEA